MSFETISPNMGLILPGVGTTSGPQYATDLNNSLTTVDGHTHAPGSGVAITPNGINISSDLSFLSNNATLLRSVKFSPQASPLALSSDIGCLYESGVDLYYNDGNGDQIRITNSGGIVGSPGSISGLTSPASATYVSGDATFVFQSAANTPGNLDFGYAILRNNVANSKGLTLSPPAAMGSNYTITLPTLPGTQSFMTLDNFGVMSAPWVVDNSTLTIASNILQIKGAGITSGLILAGTILGANIAASTITGSNIAAATITGSNIAGATITSGLILASTILGANIAASTITGSNIAAGTITGSNIAGATITNGLILAGTILGANIANATITGNNLVNGTISTTQIAAATILGSNVAASTIAGSNIASATIAGSNIAASTVAYSNLVPLSTGTSSGTTTSATTSTSLVALPGSSVAITSTGRPALISLSPGGSGLGNYAELVSAASIGLHMGGLLVLQRNGSAIAQWEFESDITVTGSSNYRHSWTPPSAFLDLSPPGGVNTYSWQYATINAAVAFNVLYCVCQVSEL